MIFNKKMIVLIVLVLGITLGTVVYGVINKVNAKEQFFDGGYVLMSNDVQENPEQQYYFNKGQKYEKKYPDKVAFKDTNGKQVIIHEENYLHYQDQSVSALMKGCFLDLDQLQSKPLTYYTISNKSIMERSGDSYIIKNVGGELRVKNILWKISENKYLILSDQITIDLGDGLVKSITGYVEVNYTDNAVVRLVNQESVFQTINQEAKLTLSNGVIINLSSKNVVTNEEIKLNLSGMSIDAEDNVEIIPEEVGKDSASDNQNQENSSDKDSTNSNSSPSSDNGSNTNAGGTTIVGGGSSGGSSNSGTVTPPSDDEDDEEEVDKKKSPVLPSASVAVEAGAIDVEAKVSIKDEENLLSGEIITRIINRGTNNVIEEVVSNAGMYEININSSKLTSNTEYWITTTATYKYENQIFNITLVQKLFRTTSLGARIDKELIGYDFASIKVMVDDYSSLTGATLRLYDNNHTLLSEYDTKIDISKAKSKDGFAVRFDNLESNTDYQIVLEDLICDAYSVVPENSSSISIKTLKELPTFGDLEVYSDKRNNLFRLSLNALEDNDLGIQSLRYEIYKETDLENEFNNGIAAKPIKTINQNKLGSVDILVDLAPFTRNEYYRFKIVAEFNDNEKIVEYSSTYSDVFSMSSKIFPTMEFILDEQSLTFKSFKGVIKLNDPDNTLSQEALANLRITFTNSIGDTGEQIGNYSTEAQGYVLELDGLRSDDTYVISVYGDINLDEFGGEQNNTIRNCLIGSKTVKTPKPDPLMSSSLTASEFEIATNAFATRLVLTPKALDEMNVLDFYSLENASRVELSLYEGEGVTGNLVAVNTFVSKGNGLVEEFYNSGNGMLITPSTFGGKNQDFTLSTYTLQVTSVLDDTRYLRPIEVEGAPIVLKSSGALPKLPVDLNDALTINTITNIASESYGDTSLDKVSDKIESKDYLEAGTTVGIEVRAKMDNSAGFIRTLTYNCIDAETNTVISTKEFSLTAKDKSVPKVYFKVDDGIDSDDFSTGNIRRGGKYYFTFTAELELDNGVTLSYPSDYEGYEDAILRSVSTILQKEKPSAKMYLEDSKFTTGMPSLNWKYMFHDIDLALDYTSGMIRYNNTNSMNTPTATTPLTKGEGNHNLLNQYRSYSFVPTENQEYRLQFLYKLYKEQPSQILPLVENYANKVITSTNLKNGLNGSIKLPQAGSNEDYTITFSHTTSDYLKNITALKVTVIDKNDNNFKQIFDFVPASYNGGILTSTLSKKQLIQFENREIEFNVEGYIDTNAVLGLNGKATGTGAEYGNTNYYALQQTAYREGDSVYGGSYYTIANDNKFVLGSDKQSAKSMFKNVVFNVDSNPEIAYTQGHPLKVTSIFNDKTIDGKNLYITNAGSALMDTTSLFYPKQLSVWTLLSNQSGGNVGIVHPTISNVLIPSSQVGIDSAHLTFNVDPNGKTFKTKGIIVEYIKKLDDGTFDPATTQTIEVDISSTNKYDVKLTGLDKNTEYGVNIYYVLNGETTRHQFADMENGGVPMTYLFRTLSKINITVDEITYIDNSYGDKYLSFNYHLGIISGFTQLDYTVYHVDKDGNEIIMPQYSKTINVESEIITNDMTYKVIRTPALNSFISGEKYMFKVEAYAFMQNTGERVDLGSAQRTFDIKTVASPLLRTSAIVGENSNILKVTIIDPGYTIAPYIQTGNIDANTYGEYEITILDSKGQPITQQQNVIGIHSLKNGMTQSFSVNMEKYDTLTAEIRAKVDINNDGIIDESENIMVTQRLSKLDDTGISLGNIQVGADTSNFNLTYRNASGLNKVEQIVYTVYNMTNGGIPFTNTLKNTDAEPLFQAHESGAYFTNQLPYPFLEKNTLYYVEMRYETSDGKAKVYSFEFQTTEKNASLLAQLSNWLFGSKGDFK